MNITEVKKKVVKIRLLAIVERAVGMLAENSKEIICFIGAFVLNFGSVWGVRPFGVAFLCACTKGKAFAFAGVILGSFFGQFGWITALSALVAFLCRIILKRFGMSDKAGLFWASVISALGLGISKPILLPLMMVLMPALTFAFGGLFHEKKPMAPAFFDAGFLCLAFGVTIAFKDVSTQLFSFGVIAASFFCLEGSERGGHLLGGLSGFFAGLSLGVEYIPPFVLASFLCGIYIRKHRTLGLFFFSLVSLGLSFAFLNGDEVWRFILSFMWGCVVWVSSCEFFCRGQRVRMPFKDMLEEEYAGKRLSAAIGSISVLLTSISKAKRREREEKTKLVVESIIGAECETCVGCSLPMSKTKGNLCRCILKNKKVCEKDFSETFVEGCPRWKVMCEKVNDMIETNPEKTELRIDTLAKDYTALAEILQLGERRREGRYFADYSAAKKIKLALELKNIRTLSVEVIGSRLPTVEITGIPFKIPFPEKTVKNIVEKILSSNVKVVHLESEGKMAKMRLKAICPMKVDFYKISVPKKGEMICGDSSAVFEGDEGLFYSVISDGMGSGRDAAVCSRLGTVFIEKLVSAGIDKAGVVSMLGNVIASSEDEVFTTVDLAEIDLVRGKLTLIKAGAAPTWIMRNGRAYSVSSKTMPCGIIQKNNAEQTVLECMSGDVVIMSSDGGECAVPGVIARLLEGKISGKPKDIASSLLDAAAQKNGRGDDISFCVMSVL